MKKNNIGIILSLKDSDVRLGEYKKVKKLKTGYEEGYFECLRQEVYMMINKVYDDGFQDGYDEGMKDAN